MPRTVVPPEPTSSFRTDRDGATTSQSGDSLPEKLVKYVPAETLAFFIPATAFLGADRKALLLLTTIVAAVGTLGYLWLSARDLSADQQPTVYFYGLAELAFFCWAVAASPNLAAVIGLDATAAGLILLGAVFLIPMADDVISKMRAGRTSGP